MEIITYISQNIKPIFYATSLVISNIYLISFLTKRNHLIHRQKTLLHKEIITLQQALQKIKSSVSSKDDNTYLIKAYPKLRNKEITIQKNLSSNQLYLLEPSFNKIAGQVISKLNQAFIEKDWKSFEKIKESHIEQELRWSIGSSSKINGQTIPLEGYGQIVDPQIFNVSCQYQQNKNIGLVKTLFVNIAYQVQYLFFHNFRSEGPGKIKSISQNSDRAPFIKGPIIGIVRYFLQFVKNKPILLEAKFQAGKILPITLASSKDNILWNLNAKIFIQNFKIIECLLVSYTAYRFLSPHIKRLKKDIKKIVKNLLGQKGLLTAHHQTFKMLQNSKITDNLICIICYTNCRNTIFFDCKHLIMCDECKTAFKDHKCPLCKAQIVEEKFLVKE